MRYNMYKDKKIRTAKLRGDNEKRFNIDDYKKNKDSEKNESRVVNKKLIRLTESDLHRIIKESVQRILSEVEDNYPRLSVEKSRPSDLPPGDQDIYYPGDVSPEALNSLSNGDFGQEATQPTYKEGDIVYWIYAYSSVFPNFYKVVKVGPKSIWIAKMGSKRDNVTMGYGSWTAVPDESNVSDKVKRIALRPNGKAYINYVGHKQSLEVWKGNPINCTSD